MLKEIHFASLFLLILFAGCSKQPPLSGKIDRTGSENRTPVVYLIDPATFDGIATSFTGKLLDSATIAENGHFAFENMPDAPGPVLLQLAIQQKGTRFPNKLDNEDPGSSNYIPFVWKNGETISVSATAGHFQKSFSIHQPSPANATMLQLRDVRQAAFEKLLSGKESEAHDPSQLMEEEQALLAFQKALMQFANESDQLLPALTAIRWTSVDGDYERIPEFIVGQCEKWKTLHPDHPMVAQLCARSNRKILPVLTGDPIPDFPLPMQSGDTLALRSLLSGKLTLLDLWASWCAPCRKENRNYLVPLWDKHHDNGFQIIGYALDGSQKAWESAIEKDGAFRWLHASHLQGDDAPLFEVLRITTIPANFLIDAEGNVVAKNLHGEELVKFVDEWMGQ